MTRALAGKRILVVDDDFFLAADLQHFLEGEGCAVAGPAPSVEGAVSCLLEGPLHAAILDVDLGSESSAPVAAELEAAGIPFLFLTGYGPESVPPQHAGRALIGKPWSQSELRMRLHDLLSQADRRVGVTHAAG
jgi:DNA-binding response OmpR family regulator